MRGYSPSYSDVIAEHDIALVAELVFFQSKQTKLYQTAAGQGAKVARIAVLAGQLTQQFIAYRGLSALPNLQNEWSEFLETLTASWLTGDFDLSDPELYDDRGTGWFRIRWIAKGDAALRIDQVICVPETSAGDRGELRLILGENKLHGTEWLSFETVSLTVLDYLRDLPGVSVPAVQRLPHFLALLDSPNEDIARDAYNEMDNAQYDDLVRLKDLLPRAKLRILLTNTETPAIRLGLYGNMLGLCGDDTDAQILEGIILKKTDEFRLDVDRLMVGYLLIRKDKGLDVLEKCKLQDTDAIFSEVFAVFQAMRFMRQFGGGCISAERLQQSIRPLLDRADLADLVIADLMRCKDWSVQDKVMKMYGADEYKLPSIKRAIVRYLHASSRDVSKDSGAAQHGQKLLDELRKKDPKTVSDAERFFVVP